MRGHTPGPWTWTPNEPHCIDSPEGHVVCGGHDYDEGGIIAEEADARLIAAAPDLLAACRAFLAADEGPVYTDRERAAIELMRAAVAKADPA